MPSEFSSKTLQNTTLLHFVVVCFLFSMKFLELVRLGLLSKAWYLKPLYLIHWFGYSNIMILCMTGDSGDTFGKLILDRSFVTSGTLSLILDHVVLLLYEDDSSTNNTSPNQKALNLRQSSCFM